MACSICGKGGHNSRKCPGKNPEEKNETKDMVLWVKFDNITNDESKRMLSGIMDLKDNVAPDSRGTFARDKKKNLPIEIKKALMIENGNE